jgi:hypothetical protein
VEKMMENRRQENSEYIFLTEQEPMWGEMLADILKQNEIPFVIQKALGGGLADRVGPLLERYAFYVSCGYLGKAQQITEEFFHAEQRE